MAGDADAAASARGAACLPRRLRYCAPTRIQVHVMAPRSIAQFPCDAAEDGSPQRPICRAGHKQVCCASARDITQSCSECGTSLMISGLAACTGSGQVLLAFGAHVSNAHPTGSSVKPVWRQNICHKLVQRATRCHGTSGSGSGSKCLALQCLHLNLRRLNRSHSGVAPCTRRPRESSFQACEVAVPALSLAVVHSSLNLPGAATSTSTTHPLARCPRWHSRVQERARSATRTSRTTTSTCSVAGGKA